MNIRSIISYGPGLWAVAIGSAALLLAACQKDELAVERFSSDRMSFQVGVAEKWLPATRSAGEMPKTEPALEFKGGGLWAVPLVERHNNPALFDAPAVQTRAAAVTKEEFYDAFSLYGYMYIGEAAAQWSEVASSAACFIDNATVKKQQGTEFWLPTQDYRWPAERYAVKFFAYAPQNLGTAGSVTLEDNTPKLTYKAPSDAAEQQDIVVASPDAVQSGQRNAVELTFRHILTAVRIKATGNTKGKISQVSLKNIRSAGTFDFGSMKWSGVESSEKTNYIEQLETAAGENGGEEDYFLIDDERTFMLLPQQLDDDAELEITIDGETLSAKIGGEGKQWTPGTTITYHISHSPEVVNYVFEVPTEEIAFTYKGNSVSGAQSAFSIRSYQENINGEVVTEKAVAWKAKFSDNGGQTWGDTPPEWLTDFTTKGEGSSTPQEYPVTVTAQTGITEDPHNDVLKNATPVTGVYDLSTKNGQTSMNTANCYVINAPGTYKLPLVYGNGIKNGQPNPSAYSTPVDEDNMLREFVNHEDDEIKSPYIYLNDDCMPKKATVVWQDAQDLVTQVKLSDNDKYLTFCVNETTIRQGNAVVAVLDEDGVIMWSWHIWVTDFKLESEPTIEERYDPSLTQTDKRVTNTKGKESVFMGVNLGWCDGKVTTYAPREVSVRFTQEGSGQTHTMVIKQLAGKEGGYGNNPYYQFGRKDPMLPGVYNTETGETEDKTYYRTTYQFTQDRERVSIGEAIQNPHIFYGYEKKDKYDWCDEFYYNLWSANQYNPRYREESVVKTIYDPSPVGYRMPSSKAFTGFTLNGKNLEENKSTFDFEQINSPCASPADFDMNHGWEFYCLPMAAQEFNTTEGTIFFPMQGNRSASSGKIRDIGINCYYWTAVTSSEHDAYNLNFSVEEDDKFIKPRSSNFRAFGFTVRPVRED